MIANELRIGSFNHNDGRVVERGHDSDWSVRQKLSHNAGVPQRIDRHFRRIKSGSRYCTRKWMPMIGVPPSTPTRFRQQRRIPLSASASLPEGARQPGGDGHRPPLDALEAAAFAGARHHKPRITTISLEVGYLQACKLADPCTRRLRQPRLAVQIRDLARSPRRRFSELHLREG